MKTPTARYLSIIFLVLALAFAGCTKKDQEGPAEAETIDSRAETLEDSSPDSPVARVDGIEIPNSHLERALIGIVLKNGMDPSQVPLFREQFGSRILDQLIQGELLYQEALKKGYTVPEEEVESSVSRFSQEFNSTEEFHAEMGRRGFNEKILREDLGKQFTIRNYIQGEIVPEAVVPEEVVREAFDQNPSNFMVPEEVKASHILIQVSNSDPQEKKDEALERAREIVSLAREGGADFAQLARERSEGPTAPSGGDLGFFGRGRMVKPFEETAFSLEVGKVSDPVLTQFGYHVIKVTERREARSLPFEEVREKLEADLKNRLVGEMVGARIEELRQAAKIEILGLTESVTKEQP